MNIIDEFLLYYAKEYEFYHEVAHQAAIVCESILQKNGIRAVVTYRAKQLESLREKIIRRNEIRQYKYFDDILKDLVDLAGVRIAVFFTSDKAEIGRLICKEFLTIKRRSFPNADPNREDKKQFLKNYTGYEAVHYRVKLDESRLEEHKKKYANTQIEIQVASSLMHAWSEVEHELVYKPRIGVLTKEESSVLDELNGLILDGEVLMEKLQDTFKKRLKSLDHQFNNHFELAALIRDRLGEEIIKNYFMGRVDVLCRFLGHLGIDNPGSIQKYLHNLESHLAYNSSLTISDCFAEMVLRDYSTGWFEYAIARFEARMHSSYKWDEKPGRIMFFKNELVRDFLNLWHNFDLVIRRTCRQNGIKSECAASVGKILLILLHNNGITLDDEIFSNLISVSSFRKKILFTHAELPDIKEVENIYDLLKESILQVRRVLPAEYQNIFDEEIDSYFSEVNSVTESKTYEIPIDI